MKYCSYCGTQLDDDASFCSSCGKATDSTAQGNVQTSAQQVYAQQAAQQEVKDNATLKTIIFVLMILTCIFMGIFTFGIALAWCIPMTVMVRKRMKTGCPVGMALKVCTLIFVNTIAGILLLTLEDGSN